MTKHLCFMIVVVIIKKFVKPFSVIVISFGLIS